MMMRILAAAALSLAAATASADIYVDDFGGGLSPVFWNVHTGGSSTVVAEGGEVVMTLGNDTGADIRFAVPLEGDFDARADYRLIGWPADNQTRIGILASTPSGSAGLGAVERISDGGFVAGNEGYVTHLLNGIVSKPTTDMAGTLRLARNGQTISGYYLEGGNWTLISSFESPDNVQGPTPLFLPVWWEGAPSVGVRIAFDNVRIEAPGTVFPPVPEPSSWAMLLGGFALVAGWVSRRALPR